MFGRHARTTASLEAYNCALNARIKTKGSFYCFALAIIDEEFMKRAEMEVLLVSAGGAIRQEKRSVCISIYPHYDNVIVYLHYFISFSLYSNVKN